MSKKPRMPARGENPRFDNVMALIERVSMDDPVALRHMLIVTLRFLRKHKLPGIMMTFDELTDTDATGVTAIVFAIEDEKETAIMHLVDAPDKIALLAAASTKSPDADFRVIDGSAGPGKPS